MKKSRSREEHAIVLSRVAAAVRLQAHRPKVEASKKQYDRTKAKRLWQKDQEALYCWRLAPLYCGAIGVRTNRVWA